MYLTLMHRQIDMVIGCKITEFLYNVLHLNHDLAFIHMAGLSHVCSLLFHMITISLNPISLSMSASCVKHSGDGTW